MSTGALFVGAGVTLFRWSAGRTFFYDEWGIVLYRRSGGWSSLLAPHNNHLNAVPDALYRLLFATVGIRSYAPYRAMGVLAHLSCAGLFLLYARRRGVQRGIALAATAVLLFLGYAWEVLLWPINIGFTIPMACLIGILLLRDSAVRHRNLLAALLLAFALASSSVGIAVAVVVAVDQLATRGVGGRGLRAWAREQPRALLAVAVPVASYLAWFLLYRPHANTPAALRHVPGASPRGDLGESAIVRIGGFPRYLLDLARNSVEGTLTVHGTAGLVVAVLVAVLVGVALAGGRYSIPRVLALVAGLLTFWLMVGVTRAALAVPWSSRYVYPAAVFLLLLVVELLAGKRVPAGVALVVVLACGAIVGHALEPLRAINQAGRVAFARHLALLADIEEHAGTVAPSFAPDPAQMPGVTAGPYLRAVKDLGSPVPKSRHEHER